MQGPPSILFNQNAEGVEWQVIPLPQYGETLGYRPFPGQPRLIP